MCFRLYCGEYNPDHSTGYFCEPCFQDWSKYHHDPCPICYSTDIIKDGLINDEETTTKPSCLHYICVDCLFRLEYNRIRKCPLCRADMTAFLNKNYTLYSQELDGLEEITILELLRLLNAYNEVLTELLQNYNDNI